MKHAAGEIRNADDLVPSVKCGVLVDDTWQRRGYSSLNGVVSVISILSGKVTYIEVMSQFCKKCDTKTSSFALKHQCANHKGSSENIEAIGAYRIFERSVNSRGLIYSEYFGGGDSKGYDEVKDIYGANSVVKCEYIGHVQKRVGIHLRNLKNKSKKLGGKGKLTDNFINKLQNYYGIAIRANVGNLLQMQSAHACSSAKNPMHKQCPEGSDSWCKNQRAISVGKNYKDSNAGLPKSIMNIIKPTYMKLCDQKLLEKCFHGKTPNANESFNNVLWTILPKNTFVELQTLSLGSSIAVLLFNDGFSGIIGVLNELGITPGHYTLTHYSSFDTERIVTSKRQCLPATKLSRKKKRVNRKMKNKKIENKEGVCYKSGDF
ncbi:hypothetical protein AVEN_242174-1 [Araneus ventricosus]|uniref:Mutator-like transposase domain-containing protein n=1 Tax=Araneus ventricosus TaxID=182803 RepID=A0A4Y2DH05_ARAVE|nr:hypothetical protein AVEN_242174-1 [Araneus ventricosus]